MRLGAGFGNLDLGTDFGAIRDVVQALDDAGLGSVSVNDHVVGGHPDRAAGRNVHTADTPVHEPLVLLAFIAAVTRRIELVSSVLLLPQRQTVLVAKQVAELDLLSGGRVRLGVGIGRNWMEYEALNENFKNRGRRLEEQVTLLRRLWTEEYVTFESEFHHLDRIGLNPNSIRKPIPIWMGSFRGAVVEKVLQRTARMADGWLPQFPADDEFREVSSRFWRYVDEAGRSRSEVGMDCPITIKKGDSPDRWAHEIEAFTALGLDVARFNGCVDTRAHQADVAADVNAGNALGVSGTPAFFINGRMLDGAQPYEAFAAIIDDELTRLRP